MLALPARQVESLSICKKQSDGTRFFVIGDCSAYDECKSSATYRRYCAGNQRYNPTTNACDDPQNVKCAPPNFLLGGHYVNWAQWRPAPYDARPSSLAPIASRLNLVYYGYAKWDLRTLDIQGTEPRDGEFYGDFGALRAANPDLKVVLTVGGWNWFSAAWSDMAGDDAKRAAFIQKLTAYLRDNQFDGVNIDWEWPGSPGRTDYVEYSCAFTQLFQDPGGDAAQDADRLLWLVRDLRAAYAGYVSLMAPSIAFFYDKLHLAEMAPYVDHFNLRAYDFTTSLLNQAADYVGPHAPLYNPGNVIAGPAAGYSAHTAVKHYLDHGVPAKKLMLGLPLFGHHWTLQGSVKGDQWIDYDLKAQWQGGKCCGPLFDSYGGPPGPWLKQCGRLMLSEINRTLGGFDGDNVVYDLTSGTNIGYAADTQTWVSFDNPSTLLLKTQYVKSWGLAGAFLYEVTFDVLEAGAMGYPTVKALRNALI